jgi:hypothetical protein
MVGVSLNSDPCRGTTRAPPRTAQTPVSDSNTAIPVDLSLFSTLHGTKLIVVQFLKKFFVFYSTKNFITCSQEVSTGSSEADKFSLHFHILLFKDPF